MFDPEWEDGCMSCAGRVDQYGNTAHLHERDTTIAVVSRAPIEKIERWKHEMGWIFPWYSSFGSRFNFDYGVSFDASVEDPAYNHRSAADWQARDAGRGRRGPRHQRVPVRWRPRLSYLLDLRPRHRAGRRHALLPRHDGTRAPRGLGGAEGSRGFAPPTRRSTVVAPGWGLVAHPLGRGVIEGGRRRLSSDTSGEA
ncbi:MAG: DUF899 family protein [Thermoleophilaceae bacterium]|nr:DUF899 family protein [Thermoleophilaceae bacterium]